MITLQKPEYIYPQDIILLHVMWGEKPNHPEEIRHLCSLAEYQTIVN